ncbi:MAG TPA: YfhO family protein [Gemmatimonadaceae bacterium]|nr:YfhO family protein [Gemmatimonadaceae bacterium]
MATPKDAPRRSAPPLALEDRAPRHATLWAALVYAASTMLLGYPALVGRFLVNPRSDQYIAGYAFREYAAQWLKSGHGFPQWNPFLQGGLPYIAAMHGDIFYPTFLLRMIMPTDAAMTWEFVIHLFLAGLFTYLFLRAWRFGFWPSLIGGLAYMMGGAVAGLASPGHDGKLFVEALTPLGLLLVTRSVRDGRTWAWGTFALVVGLAFLSPHPQLFEYFLILAGCFALYVAFANHPGTGKLERNVAIKRLAIALGCVVLGVLIGAVQYWPSLLEYKPWSPRAGGHSWADATSYSYPIEEILNWYWPQFSGILDNYWGQNGIHLHSDYFGVIALVLAGAAFGKSERSSFRRFWWITGLVSLIWALGGFTPFYHVIMAIVPMTKYLRAPSTMIYVTSLSVAVLAAVGIERIAAGRLSPTYALSWIAAGAIFAILMSVGGYTGLSNAAIDAGASHLVAVNGYPPEAHAQFVGMFAPKAEANTGQAIFGVWRSFLFVLLGAGVLWALAMDRVKLRAAAIALVVLLAVDLWSIERLYWIFSPPASQLFTSDAAIDAIKADIAKNGPARVQNPTIGGDRMALELGRTDRAFTGDKLMIFGLRLDTGYHGNELGMYDRLTALSTPDSLPIRYTPQFWRHENVRYWYTVLGDTDMYKLSLQLRVPPFTKLAGPVKDAAGSTVYAYKLPEPDPAAWVASAIIKAPQDRALGAVLDPSFNPATVAVADTSATNVQGAQLQALPAATTTTANVTSYAPGAIDVALSQPAAAGQALVVSENYYPGWQATVDGKPAPVGLMNYNLVGVALPQGARAVQLRFVDAAYEKGKIVTWIALLLAIAWLAFGVVVDRRTGQAYATA